MDLITVTKLTKKFAVRKRKPGLWGAVKNLVSAETSELAAVDAIDFQVRRGELVGYLGPNGAGKSTTIKMLTGILQPSSGRILVDGIDPSRSRRKLTRRIGVVFGQKTQLWWDLPVNESFDLLRTIYKIPGPIFKERMEFFEHLLGLGDFLHQQTRKLSLGQRMRADLAASLLHDPPVLFLDEPTIGLDILSREAIRDFIKEINQKRKTTILLTTHDMQDIEYLANRLILLDKGRIQYDGGVDEFTRQYTREKILTVRLETPCDPDIFARAGFQVKKQHSPLHFELVTGAEGSVGPLIEAITGGGGRIQEINVRRQDLADTLKLMYSGSKAEF